MKSLPDDPFAFQARAMTIRVTNHACDRFIAAEIGCQVVRLAGGERLILEGRTVVSVYARHNLPRQCRSPFREQC